MLLLFSFVIFFGLIIESKKKMRFKKEFEGKPDLTSIVYSFITNKETLISKGFITEGMLRQTVLLIFMRVEQV